MSSSAEVQSIPVVCVSYNSAELISDLLSSFRKHYANPVTIIDGSEEAHYKAIEQVASGFENVRFIHFDYNIHHGPGMAWAINHLELSGQVLFLDSDLQVLHPGFLEALNTELAPQMYGVGMVVNVNEGGFNVSYEKGAIKYLHPACMLCNIEVMRQWPLPLKHGAPMTAAMTALHKADASHLIGNIPWLVNDFGEGTEKTFIRHDWRGTVLRTGGYHLDEWQRNATEAATFQTMLLSLVPPQSKRLVEVACGSGDFARVYKTAHPESHYIGIEADPSNARLASVFCNAMLSTHPAQLGEADFEQFTNSDCWLLFDVLATVNKPLELLKKIRETLTLGGCIVASIPNAQHWMVQAKLSVGDFRYEDKGLLDRTHIRFFTRATMLELFKDAGFQIEQGFPRIVGELTNENVKAAIKLMATAVGADPELALQDSLPMQYVVKAVAK